MAKFELRRKGSVSPEERAEEKAEKEEDVASDPAVDNSTTSIPFDNSTTSMLFDNSTTSMLFDNSTTSIQDDASIPSMWHLRCSNGLIKLNANGEQTGGMLQKLTESEEKPDPPEVRTTSTTTTKTRRVHFDFESTQFFSNGREIDSLREWHRCWYTEKALRVFKKGTSKTADKILSPRRKWRPGSKRTTKLRETLASAFQSCRAVKKEEDMDNENLLSPEQLANLTEIYQETADLVGLEVFLLHALRGETSFLCRRLLSFVDEKMHESTASKKKATFLYARTSQTISRSSRLYVRELAKAQAAALAASP